MANRITDDEVGQVLVEVLLLRKYYLELVCLFRAPFPCTYISRGLQLKQRVRGGQGRCWSALTLRRFARWSGSEHRYTIHRMPALQSAASLNDNVWCNHARISAALVSIRCLSAITRPRASLQHYGRGCAQDLSALNAVTCLDTSCSPHSHRTSSTTRSRNLGTS